MITKTHKHNNTSRITHPLQEGEFVIIKDDPGASDWYPVLCRDKEDFGR